MNKKTQTMVILGLVAVGGYMWWKSRQDKTTEGTSSAIGGTRKTVCCKKKSGEKYYVYSSGRLFPCADGDRLCSYTGRF